MNSILTIIMIILPIICAEYQELELIRKLNIFFKFDHNIFLFESSVDMMRLIDTKEPREITPSSFYKFKSIDPNTTRMTYIGINSKNTFVIVSPDGSNFERIYILLTRVRQLQRRQRELKIGIFFPVVTSSEDLQKLFEWSWENRIINIFAATYIQTSSSDSLNIFNFNPFGTLDVVNFTDSKTVENIFLRQNSNYQGHPIRVARFGSDDFWLVVFRVLNASFKDVKYNASLSRDDLFDSYDIGVGALRSNAHPFYLPIVNVDSLVFVVPEALLYGEFAAYLQAIMKNSFFGYASLIIIGVILILAILRYISRKRCLFLESVADVLNLLMNDNSSIKYQRLYRYESFIIVPLTFVGLVFVNGIFSTLQSYVTQPILQPQIDTIEDIYNSPFTVVAETDFEKRCFLPRITELSKRTDWDDKILVDANVIKLAEKYNRSFIFLLYIDIANQLLRVQKQLGIKGYHIGETFSQKFYQAYQVHYSFPFIKRLEEIIGQLQNAGLYDEWKRRKSYVIDKKFMEASRDLFKNLTQSNEADEIDNFPIPMFIVYGWIGSAIVFVAELIWKNMKNINGIFRTIKISLNDFSSKIGA